MMDSSFDALVYVRNAPVLSMEAGIQLAQTLVAAVPKGLPAYAKKAVAKLSRVAEAAQAALTQRQRELVEPPGESARDIDILADQVWSALHDVLLALSRLPESHERAAQARHLRATLFPEGTGFLRLPYTEQVVRMDVTLKRIEQEGLAKKLDVTVGPEFLQELRAIQPRYVAMVQARLREAAPAASFLEHTRAMQRAILEYATVVAGTVDSEDPESVAMARQSLRPLDNYREQQATLRSPAPSDNPAPEPQPAPSPPIDPGTPS